MILCGRETPVGRNPRCEVRFHLVSLVLVPPPLLFCVPDAGKDRLRSRDGFGLSGLLFRVRPGREGAERAEGVVLFRRYSSRVESRFPRLSTGCRWLHQQGDGSPYTTVSRPIVYKQKRRFVLHFLEFVSSSCPFFKWATASARPDGKLFNFWNTIAGPLLVRLLYLFFFSHVHGLSEA